MKINTLAAFTLTFHDEEEKNNFAWVNALCTAIMYIISGQPDKCWTIEEIEEKLNKSLFTVSNDKDRKKELESNLRYLVMHKLLNIEIVPNQESTSWLEPSRRATTTTYQARCELVDIQRACMRDVLSLLQDHYPELYTSMCDYCRENPPLPAEEEST